MSAESDFNEDTNWTRLVRCSLPEETRKALKLRASRHRTLEICGFIIDESEIYPISNVAQIPGAHFIMEDREMRAAARVYQERITGIYHSHPSGRPWLSPTDEKGVADIYRAGCPWRYFVVTASAVTEYRWSGETQEEAVS